MYKTLNLFRLLKNIFYKNRFNKPIYNLRPLGAVVVGGSVGCVGVETPAPGGYDVHPVAMKSTSSIAKSLCDVAPTSISIII